MTREEAIVWAVRCLKNRDFYPDITSNDDGTYSLNIGNMAEILTIRSSRGIQPITESEINEAFAIAAGSET